MTLGKNQRRRNRCELNGLLLGGLRRASGAILEERGQSLVELAMVLPMLLLVMLGVYGFGSFFAKYQTITSATTAAARFEATCRTQTTGSAHATGQAASTSLSNASFTFKLAGTNTDEPDGATCSIPDGTRITVSGAADSFTINLGFYRFTLPVSSSVTVVEE